MKNDFEKWESAVNHMYLDTRGNVTVGIGNLIGSVAAAQSLRFIQRMGGKSATAQEIKDEFEEVKELDFGNYKASWYKSKTVLNLPDAECWELLNKRIDDEFLPSLKVYFDQWSLFPVDVKRALLDMAYNLGMGSASGGGLRAFKNLKAAVDKMDWSQAADECHRGGISQDRNDWTRDFFRNAAAQKK